MGTKSPLGVIHPLLPGAPRSERRDWRVLRRETPERVSLVLSEELERARRKERWERRVGVKHDVEDILSVVRSMA